MTKRLSILLAMVAILLPLAGCGSDDEPIQRDTLSSADIAYTLTLSPDILDYFNITANYYNASGLIVGKQMDEPQLTVISTVKRFPATRPLTFTVTRKDTPAPTEAPSWSMSIEYTVTKHYSPSGTYDTSYHKDSKSFSPLPGRFEDWAVNFQKEMARGYTVTVDADGKITY